MRRNQRATLHYRNWWRSLYADMRRDERYLARQRRRLAQEWRDGSPVLVASSGRLIRSIMRHIDQSWRFLQREEP